MAFIFLLQVPVKTKILAGFLKKLKAFLVTYVSLYELLEYGNWTLNVLNKDLLIFSICQTAMLEFVDLYLLPPSFLHLGMTT